MPVYSFSIAGDSFKLVPNTPVKSASIDYSPKLPTGAPPITGNVTYNGADFTTRISTAKLTLSTRSTNLLAPGNYTYDSGAGTLAPAAAAPVAGAPAAVAAKEAVENATIDAAAARQQFAAVLADVRSYIEKSGAGDFSAGGASREEYFAYIDAFTAARDLKFKEALISSSDPFGSRQFSQDVAVATATTLDVLSGKDSQAKLAALDALEKASNAGTSFADTAAKLIKAGTPLEGYLQKIQNRSIDSADALRATLATGAGSLPLKTQEKIDSGGTALSALLDSGKKGSLGGPDLKLYNDVKSMFTIINGEATKSFDNLNTVTAAASTGSTTPAAPVAAVEAPPAATAAAAGASPVEQVKADAAAVTSAAAAAVTSAATAAVTSAATGASGASGSSADPARTSTSGKEQVKADDEETTEAEPAPGAAPGQTIGFYATIFGADKDTDASVEIEFQEGIDGADGTTYRMKPIKGSMFDRSRGFHIRDPELVALWKANSGQEATVRIKAVPASGGDAIEVEEPVYIRWPLYKNANSPPPLKFRFSATTGRRTFTGVSAGEGGANAKNDRKKAAEVAELYYTKSGGIKQSTIDTTVDAVGSTYLFTFDVRNMLVPIEIDAGGSTGLKESKKLSEGAVPHWIFLSGRSSARNTGDDGAGSSAGKTAVNIAVSKFGIKTKAKWISVPNVGTPWDKKSFQVEIAPDATKAGPGKGKDKNLAPILGLAEIKRMNLDMNAIVNAVREALFGSSDAWSKLGISDNCWAKDPSVTGTGGATTRDISYSVAGAA